METGEEERQVDQRHSLKTKIGNFFKKYFYKGNNYWSFNYSIEIIIES